MRAKIIVVKEPYLCKLVSSETEGFDKIGEHTRIRLYAAPSS